jgi:GR25 family glycosyltransferase involved in LPS biosynthesis
MIPIVITQRGSERIGPVTERLGKSGVEKFKFFYGFNGAKSGLKVTIPYLHNDPSNPHYIGSKEIGCTMSHIMLWSALELSDENDHWLVLEDDVIFRDGWKESINLALEEAPKDWDMIFAGSCCAQERVGEKVGHALYRCHPLCTHAYLVRRKALKTLLETTVEISAPIDLLIFFKSRHLLNSYSILPRVADQVDTDIPD